MVKIPQMFDQTLAAMYDAIKQGQDRSRRNYLGASIIGRECPRQIWYDYNGYEKPLFEADALMRFESGHRVEDLTAERLRLVSGITLITHNEEGGQLGFADFDGKFKGHVDGLIHGLRQAPTKWHIWEHKDVGEKIYNKFGALKAEYGEKKTLRQWNIVYYAQAQIYMHYFQLDRHYMTVSSAGGRAYNSCRTEYNAADALKYIDKAKKIIEAKEPPVRISEKPDFFQCRWCDFKDICHGQDSRKRTVQMQSNHRHRGAYSYAK